MFNNLTNPTLLDSMYKDYTNFCSSYANYSKFYVWQRFIRSE